MSHGCRFVSPEMYQCRYEKLRLVREVVDQGRCLSQASLKIDSIAEKLSGLAKTVDQLISTVNDLATTTGELVESEQHAMEKFRRLVGELGGPSTSAPQTARRNGAGNITP